MKKIITIFLCIALIEASMPVDAFCLRPISSAHGGDLVTSFLPSHVINLPSTYEGYNTEARIAEIMRLLFQQPPVIDARELSGYLIGLTKRYKELFAQFKEEAKCADAPFAASLPHKDYYHPVSRWVLEGHLIDIYDFKYKGPTLGNTSLLLSFFVALDMDGKKIVCFAPGTHIDKRIDDFDEKDDRLLRIEKFKGIPGRITVRIIEPKSEVFKDEVKSAVESYVEKEQEFLEMKKTIDSLGVLTVEERKSVEPGLNTLHAELEYCRIALEKIAIMIRERVVAEREVPEEDAYPYAGIMSYKELGLSSPMELLYRINEIYPAIAQLLLTGKVPAKLQEGALMLPAPIAQIRIDSAA